MSHPSPSQIIANVERALVENPSYKPVAPASAKGTPSAGEGPGLLTEYPPPPSDRQLFESLERGILPELRRREAVDQPPAEGGSGLLKRVVGRLVRFVSSRQAAFNRKSIEGLEITAGEVDSLRSRLYWDVRGVHEKLAQLEEKRRDDRTWIDEVHHRLTLVKAEVATRDERISALERENAALAAMKAQVELLNAELLKRTTWSEHEKVWAQIQSLAAGLSEKAAQSDVTKIWEELPKLSDAINVRAAQSDVSKLWEEIPRLVAAIEARASQGDVEKLWQEVPKLVLAIEQRAAQGDVSKLWEEVPRLVAAIEQRAAQSDVSKLWEEVPKLVTAIEQRAAQDDVAKLWKETVALHARVGDELAGVWSGIGERDRQIGQDTAAIQQLHGALARAEGELRELRARLAGMGAQLAALEERPVVAASSASVATASAVPTIAPAPARSLQAARLERVYLEFQHLFRGSEEDLRARFSRYVPLLTELLPPGALALDVACGDGIFVDVLRGAGFTAAGVDINRVSVAAARQRGLTVAEGDGIEFLEGLEAGSLDLVTSLQFVEHLPPDVLFRYLSAAARALRPGGLLLVETLNPHTLKSLHWYFLDLSHARLIFPEMLKLLCESVSLGEVEWRGINPVSGDERLAVPTGEPEQSNTQRLNKLLFGDQDYFLIAKKQ